MIKVGISMRVDTNLQRQERSDAIDQRACKFVTVLGGQPVPVPNVADATPEWLEYMQLDAIVLSGGNDLAAVGGNAPERDTTEMHLLAWASRHNIPVLGICRGMQLIASVAGVALEHRANHAGGEHSLRGPLLGKVPTHHNWCITRVPEGFEVLAYADDESIEALRSFDRRVLGLMWHPERMDVLRPVDAEAITSTIFRSVQK